MLRSSETAQKVAKRCLDNFPLNRPELNLAPGLPLRQWQSLSGIHQDNDPPIAVGSLAFSWGRPHSQRAYLEAKAKVANAALKMVTAANANILVVNGFGAALKPAIR